MAKAKAKVKSTASKKAPSKSSSGKAATRRSIKVVAKATTATPAKKSGPLALGHQVLLLSGLFKGTKGVVTKLGKSVQVQVKFAGEHTMLSLPESDLQRV